MSVFMLIGTHDAMVIEGECSEAKYEKWLNVLTVSDEITQRAVPDKKGAYEAVLGEVTITREADKASIKLRDSCAKGTLLNNVEIQLTTKIDGIAKPYLWFIMTGVRITSFKFDGAHLVDGAQPTETIHLDCNKIQWKYKNVQSKDATWTIASYNKATTSGG